MELFTEQELAYLQREKHLGRLATVGRDGTPHVAPVGWTYNQALGTIDIGGFRLTRTKKFRDITRSARAAIVIDDVQPPWRPRGIEIRGEAEAIDRPHPLIRIHPRRVISWGLDDADPGERQARDVSAVR